jgi:hypothetical protein
MKKKKLQPEREALAYYLEPLVENPWIVGYMPEGICRALEESGFLDPETFRVTPKGRVFLVAEGYLETAYRKPTLTLIQ